MRVYYENVNITDSVEVVSCVYEDAAGGVFDSLVVSIADIKGIWRKWAPQIGHRIKVETEYTNSGTMFVDRIIRTNGVLEFKAVSAPKTAKRKRYESYEGVTLLALGNIIALRHGLKFVSYSATDVPYLRLSQLGQSDFLFLSNQAKLESCSVKVFDETLYLIDEKNFESKAPSKTLSLLDGISFKEKYNPIYKQVSLSSQNKEASFSINQEGQILRVSNVDFTSEVEGNRYARGILRAVNKAAHLVIVDYFENAKLSPFDVVNLEEISLNDGKYMIEKRSVDMLLGKSTLTMRRVLEGY